MSVSRLTQDQIGALAAIAAAAAYLAPLKQRHQYSTLAYVPWDLINQAREILDAGGIDWKAEHKKLRAKS